MYHPLHRTWSHSSESPARQRTPQKVGSSSAELTISYCNPTKTWREPERMTSYPNQETAIQEGKLHTEDNVYSLRGSVTDSSIFHKHFFPPVLQTIWRELTFFFPSPPPFPRETFFMEHLLFCVECWVAEKMMFWFELTGTC